MTKHIGQLLDALHKRDIALLRWFNHHRSPGSDSLLISFSFATTFVSCFLLLVILIRAIRKKSKVLRKRFTTVLFVLLSSAIVGQVIKRLVNRTRPFESYSFIEKLSEGGNASFPSGHTLEAFAMATGLTLVFRRPVLSVLLFAWAALVGYSRMALGVHYPSDVLGGALIGMATAWLVTLLMQKQYAGQAEQGS